MMDEMERKIKAYFDEAAPDPSFCERLLALEDEVSPRPSRRRYLLPIAAVLAVALAFGGGWRYLRNTLPQDPPAPMAVNEEPAQTPEAPDNTVPADVPDDPESTLPTPQTPVPQPETNAPEPEGEAAAKPEPPGAATHDPAPAPQKPAESPAEPPAVNPAPPEKPGALPEGSQTPVITPDPPENNPDPPDTPPNETPDPPEQSDPDPPAPITLSAGFFSSGGKDFISVTNTATGETVTFDVTGQCPAPAKFSSSGDTDPNTAESDREQTKSYSLQRSAFGTDIVIYVTRDGDGGADTYANPIG